jgi:putative transposase
VNTSVAWGLVAGTIIGFALGQVLFNASHPAVVYALRRRREKCGLSPSEADLTLMRRVDELHLRWPFLGARKLRDLPNRDGFAVGRKHVGTLMRKMGITAIYRAPKTSTPGGHEHRVYPYLLKNLMIERANRVWAADITYLPMAKCFLYLVAIMECASRRVLAWRTSNTLTTDFCVEALHEALIRLRDAGDLQHRPGQPVHP